MQYVQWQASGKHLLNGKQPPPLCFELHSSWLENSCPTVMSQNTANTLFPFHLIWAVLADLYLPLCFSHSEICSVFCNALFRGYFGIEILSSNYKVLSKKADRFGFFLQPKLYRSVIEDVINDVREVFLDEGVDEQVLMELKTVSWNWRFWGLIDQYSSWVLDLPVIAHSKNAKFRVS